MPGHSSNVSVYWLTQVWHLNSSMIQLQFMSNAITFQIHPTITNLVEDEITAYTSSGNSKKKLPFFHDLSIILTNNYHFRLNILSSLIWLQCSSPLMLLSSFAFKPFKDSIVNVKSSGSNSIHIILISLPSKMLPVLWLIGEFNTDIIEITFFVCTKSINHLNLK